MVNGLEGDKMKHKLIVKLAACFFVLATGMGLASAQDQFAPEFTPMGAERAGNAAGTIPAWTGGLTAAPEGYQRGEHYRDPFSEDKPLFTITAANVSDYGDKLPSFSKELFARFPETYKIHVYPTRRSCALPKRGYEEFSKNAQNAKMINDTQGISGANMVSPFPFPKTAEEVLWNHRLSYRPAKMAGSISGGSKYQNGHFTHVVRQDLIAGKYHDPDAVGDEVINNAQFTWRGIWTAPNDFAGAGFSMTNFINQIEAPRSGFMFMPDQRRVVRATPSSVTYDAPLGTSFGIRYSDNMFIFSGAHDRYEWALKGKKEVYIPYNVYQASDEKSDIDNLLTINHLNQDMIRYELHRVWVVEGIIKPKYDAHPISRRVFYIDEDSWIIAYADLYDTEGKLFRGQEGFIKNLYDIPACVQDFDVMYDFTVTHYNVDHYKGEFGPYKWGDDAPIKDSDFGAQALRRAIKR